MRSIKKIILTLMMILVFSVSAFAASGFEAILNVPIGLSVGFQNYKLSKEAEAFKDNIDKYYKQNSSVGFDIGVTAQLGYMFQVKEGFGISVLGEIGYSHDSYAFILASDKKISQSYTFESIQIGLLPKFNIGAFAIGIGGGVKIPLAGNSYFRESDGGYTSQGYDYKKLKDTFTNPYIPYVKGVVDFLLPYNIVLGVYASYDIPLVEHKDPGNNIKMSAFDLGAEVGLRF